MNQKEARISKLIELAGSLEGRPYKYGAKMKDAPWFFDCSLYIQYIFKKAGMNLPRTAIEQAMAGKKVALSKIKKGDLIFMKGELGRYNKYFPEGVGHVGIYIGNGKIMHAERRRISGKYEDIYNPKLIKEIGGVVVDDLSKFLKKKRKLAIIKRYI